MKITEFKIGNKILYRGGQVTISEISQKGLHFESPSMTGSWWNPESSSFSPILITEKELVKMGCKRAGPLGKNISVWEYGKKLAFVFNKSKKEITLNVMSQGYCIKALHILQNILNDISENTSLAW